MFKKVIIIFLLGIILCACGLFNTSNQYAEDAENTFVDTTFQSFMDNKNLDYAKALIQENAEINKIGDYKITLERTLYDDSTKIGYVMFAIEKEGAAATAKGKDTIDRKHLCDERFYLDVLNPTRYIKESKNSGDTLDVYFKFSEEKNFKGELVLFDSYENKSYIYHIPKKSDAKSFSEETTQIELSSIGLILRDVGEMPEHDPKITITYKDGTEKTIVSETDFINTGSSHASGNGENYYRQYFFSDLIDIEEVESLNIND